MILSFGKLRMTRGMAGAGWHKGAARSG